MQQVCYQSADRSDKIKTLERVSWQGSKKLIQRVEGKQKQKCDGMMLQPVLSYWTIPYVCIDDTRLVWLYNVAFVSVLASLLANIFCHMTYLQSDTLHGISQVHIYSVFGLNS